jgi:hypothetical protein
MPNEETKRALTDAERIGRVWDVLQIKNLMGRHAYLHAYNLPEEVLDTLWVREAENQKTASFGRNCGYWIGADDIRRYYTERNAEALYSDRAAAGAGGFGAGAMRMHTLTTPYVVIAGDGRTAQGLWYSPGQITARTPDGADAAWIYERYGADLVREADGWRIWHLFAGTDFVLRPGALKSEQPVPDAETAAEPWPEMTLKMRAYGARYNYAPYPRIPTPYKSFDPAFGNGPEGNPLYNKGEDPNER